jgi:hypothetical protein
MKNENQGKTDNQIEFALYMFSTSMLTLIVLGLVFLIKYGFGF